MPRIQSRPTLRSCRQSFHDAFSRRPAADEERDRDGEEHDADATDEEPHRVLDQLEAVGTTAATERAEAIHAAIHAGAPRLVVHSDPCSCFLLDCRSVQSAIPDRP